MAICAEDVFYFSKLSQLNCEEWITLPGFNERYQISNLGRIKSFAFGGEWRILSGALDSSVRPRFRLSIGGVASTHIASHLVMLAFVGERPQSLVVCHNNGNPTDNRLFNLRYDTQRNNQKDRSKHIQLGIQNRAVACRDEIRQLLLSSCLTRHEVCVLFGVTLRQLDALEFA